MYHEVTLFDAPSISIHDQKSCYTQIQLANMFCSILHAYLFGRTLCTHGLPCCCQTPSQPGKCYCGSLSCERIKIIVIITIS